MDSLPWVARTRRLVAFLLGLNGRRRGGGQGGALVYKHPGAVGVAYVEVVIVVEGGGDGHGIVVVQESVGSGRGRERVAIDAGEAAVVGGVGAPVGVVADDHVVLRVERRLPGGDVREDLRGVAGVDDLGVAGGEQFLV